MIFNYLWARTFVVLSSFGVMKRTNAENKLKKTKKKFYIPQKPIASLIINVPWKISPKEREVQVQLYAFDFVDKDFH